MLLATAFENLVTSKAAPASHLADRSACLEFVLRQSPNCDATPLTLTCDRSTSSTHHALTCKPPSLRTAARNQGGLNMRMDGKIGIVTAAASGMGRAGALRFAREGARVAVVDVDAAGVRRVVDEITRAGGTGHGIVADLTRDEDSRRIVWDTVNRFKGLDFVWNHVGHPGPAAVEGIDLSAFDLAIDLNLRTVLITTEAAIPELRARGGGSLLYTASTSGLVGSGFSPVYSMCKFGVVGFVKSLALRLARDGIRVNAVCPGPIDTPMLRVFVARPDQKSTAGLDPEELVQKRAHGSVPLGRTGRPEEIANAALFLLSDEASFITGAALPVDGGVTAA